ncbi:MAG: hypothetical protein GEU26_03225 [Nitrososphaeraceae archaeon]|nr:hypothetical protein [Nitrososphaeraceae archaeon]
MKLVMRLDKKVRCFTNNSSINAMKKAVVINRPLIMMVIIVAGFLLLIVNSLDYSALGLIDGTDNDDVLIANMSIFSSRSSTNNFSSLNTEGRSGLIDTTNINDNAINDRNRDSLDNDSDRGVFMYGNYGNDEIHGTDKSDHLRGGPGNDTIYGYGGGDYIEGGNGNDTLYGGDGDDVLVGGPGSDYFDCGEGYDIVEDFHPEEGDIAMSNCEELLDEVYNR